LYPFLDRQAFEAKAFSPNLDIELANEASWAALYYSVLALGCEFDGGGSFAPGEGEPWSFFKVALDHYPKVLLLNTDLLEVQVCKMSIYLYRSLSARDKADLYAGDHCHGNSQDPGPLQANR
jgi:hypothetical protein